MQTVALRIIVERETERERFVPVPYFSVPVDAREGRDGLPRPRRRLARARSCSSTAPTRASPRARRPRRCSAHVEASALRVVSVEARERRQNPAPPFTTSKLQQAAARSLGFSVRKTMTLAQRLYEGKTVGEQGTVGLITYMRTDSDRVADEALDAVREHIRATYGEAALPAEPRRYKQKKDVQDAHEAIRPTTLDLPPEAVAAYVEPDELKLYRLIWNRFVASQMNPAVSEVTTVEIEARREGSPDLAGPPRHRLRPQGPGLPARLRPGGRDRGAERARGRRARATRRRCACPRSPRATRPSCARPRAEGHETQPPPRFNEASLVKFMEENGIGRPSTYADILRKIEQREYVHKKDRRFIPTPLGRLVVDLMKEGFEDFFQTEYTARMEEELDEVEEGKVDWRQALRDFDGKFSKDRERAKKQMHSVKAGLEMPLVREAFTDFRLTNDPGDTCPESGHPLKLRMGKAGLFVACSGYPDCTWTVDIPETEEDPVDPSELEGQTCEECGSPMRLRTGQERLGLPRLHRLPEVPQRRSRCRSRAGKAEARPAEPTGEKCPVCGHDLVKRHGRFGEYVSCSNYPDCRYKPPEAGDAHRRHLPRVQPGPDPRAQGPLRPVLRLLALPRVHAELPGAAGAEALPEVRDGVPARARAQGGRLLRLRGGGVRLRRAGRRPRPLSRDDRGHRGGAPGRARRRGGAGAEEARAATEGRGARGGRRSRGSRRPGGAAGTGRAAGKRPARPAAAAKPRRAPARKAAASARPKRRPVKK